VSQRRLRSEFIIKEPPKERTRRRFQKVGMIAILVFAGIVTCSYLNYNNQVLGQQIDIANRSIGTLHRLQNSKQLRLNEEMKFDVIQRKAALLGFTISSNLTQVIPAPNNQFDLKSIAIFAKHRVIEHENMVPSFTQHIVKPVIDHN